MANFRNLELMVSMYNIVHHQQKTEFYFRPNQSNKCGTPRYNH